MGHIVGTCRGMSAHQAARFGRMLLRADMYVTMPITLCPVCNTRPLWAHLSRSRGACPSVRMQADTRCALPQRISRYHIGYQRV